MTKEELKQELEKTPVEDVVDGVVEVVKAPFKVVAQLTEDFFNWIDSD